MMQLGMATTCYHCVRHTPPEIWWWLGIGIAAYLIVWWRVLWGRPQWANGAGVLGLPVAMIGFMPSFAIVTLNARLEDFGTLWWVLIPAVIWSLLCCAPFFVGNRRYWKWKSAQEDLAKQARADGAEQLLRRLGA